MRVGTALIAVSALLDLPVGMGGDDGGHLSTILASRHFLDGPGSLSIDDGASVVEVDITAKEALLLLESSAIASAITPAPGIGVGSFLVPPTNSACYSAITYVTYTGPPGKSFMTATPGRSLVRPLDPCSGRYGEVRNWDLVEQSTSAVNSIGCGFASIWIPIGNDPDSAVNGGCCGFTDWKAEGYGTIISFYFYGVTTDFFIGTGPDVIHAS